jgi:ATP-dependent helicase/nuclease subunit A
VTAIFSNDIDLRLPHFTVISASAGSGKTHTLTLKILQLLLSNRIPNNRLNNILAITFTKNAAAEMRRRVLEYLKKAYHGDPGMVDQLHMLVSMGDEQLRSRCAELIETILQDYSAFQIQTIDSFLARVFRTSALEFGFSPSLEIVLDSRPILNEAFEQFARDLAVDPKKRALLEQLADILVESSGASSRYVWNPFQRLSDEVRSLYERLIGQAKEIISVSDSERNTNALRQDILAVFQEILKIVKDSGLETTKNFEHAVTVADAGDVDKLVDLQKSVGKPVKAGKSKNEKQKGEEWNTRLLPLQGRFNELASTYVVQQARNYYRPYVEAHKMFSSTVENIVRRRSQIFLGDVTRVLLTYISEEIVPQIYFYLGDAISHYLIDEFQDTSPSQWETMEPLFAEALSKQGSLVVVGDTKQSIYAFRQADWRIMKMLMDNVVFPSAPPEVRELETNYRSYERIVDFGKKVFQAIVPSMMEGDAPHASGLSSFKQEVREGNRKKGYVEVASFEEDEVRRPERAKILETVVSCHDRGYAYGDVTILTPKNEHVITVSEWLNSAGIPFISHSSLDIRGRTVTGEILALLRFLDSPIDDLAFATVLLGDVFRRVLRADGAAVGEDEFRSFLLESKGTPDQSPLYISFRRQYGELWRMYFEDLFNVVGYLPMYDLVSEIYGKLRIFELEAEEEGTLTKLLEIMKDFEETGRNNLKDFLTFAEEEGSEAEWNIAVPRGADAVSIMTIHKAKGLDNRVVIVLLADARPRMDNLFVEEDEEGVRLVRITQKTAEFDGGFQGMYNERKIRRTVDDLNKLYVAFTRAKEEMYVISVKNNYADEPSRFLPQTGFEPSAKPKVEEREKSLEPAASLHHPALRVPPSAVAPEKLALYERRRGEAIHDILSCINFADADTSASVLNAAREIAGNWADDAELTQLVAVVMDFLRLPDIAPFFARMEERTILNEQEFVDPDGRLFRMDRIVVDEKTVTVLDFKTGEDKNTYADQLRGYMKILENYYPGRAIGALLAFVDRKKTRVIA